MTTRVLTLTAIAFSVIPLSAQCKSSCQPMVPVSMRADTIVATAAKAGNFQTLLAAATAAGLAETLASPGPFTVFAPTDAAFAKLPEGAVASLLLPANRARLATILKHHVVQGDVRAKDVLALRAATSLSGQQLSVSQSDAGVSVDGVAVTATDIVCSNGVIHVVDAVLMPEERNVVEVATAAKTFSTLLAAAQAAGLVSTLVGSGPLTVFAPTDEAFAKLPEGTVTELLKAANRDRLTRILKHHVVAGRVFAGAAVEAKGADTLEGTRLSISKTAAGVQVGSARVIAADIDACNGVIHIIDSVLLP